MVEMNDTNLHGSAEMIHYRMIVFLKFALGSTKKTTAALFG